MAAARIRWGFLGTAGIGAGAYVPAIRESGNGSLHAVASRKVERAEEFAAKHGFVRAYGTYEELLADPEIDAVYLPLPNALHREWSLQAAAAGKPVLCEKPLALSAAEAREMVEAFRSRNLLLAEAFMYAFHPLTRTALGLLREGRIGELKAVRSSFFAVDDKPASDIRFSAELGGGALRDLGCYCLAIIRDAVGEEPVEVRAVSDWLPSGVDGRTAASLKFPGGVVAEFSCGLQTPFSASYEFIGTRGRILVDEGAMVAWAGGVFPIKVWTSEGGFERIEVGPANHYRLMAEAFADAVLGRRPMDNRLEWSIANAEAIDRVEASAKG